MNSKTAIMLLEHTSYDDFNLLEHQIKSRLEAIQVLIQENNQLKENLKLEKQISNGIAKDCEILLNQKKELRAWLEELIKESGLEGIIQASIFNHVLDKLNELEGDVDEN